MDGLKDIAETQWPGFEVKCKKCDSYNVSLHDTRGYSDLSGTWGGIELLCEQCDNKIEIIEN